MIERQEQANKAFDQKRFEDMIFFQNLVPGTSDSDFVASFREFCLDKDDDDASKEYRSALLQSPLPILTFKNKKEENDYYGAQAKNCTQFCCGGGSLSGPILTGGEFISEDRYKVSLGTGQLYEGKAADIRSEMQMDIDSAQMDSPEQYYLQAGLDEFNSFVVQRQQSVVPMTAMPDSTSTNQSIKSIDVRTGGDQPDDDTSETSEKKNRSTPGQ